MKKLAGDVIHRVFNAMSDESEEFNDYILDKTTFIRCFCNGKSKSKWGKAIKKRKVDLGGEMKVISKDTEKTFLTSQIFEKPISIWLSDTGQYYSKESVESSEEYLYRHAFIFERSDLTHLVNIDDPILETFIKIDKYSELGKVKDDIIKELVYKFSSDDVKIIHVMKEVLDEKFVKGHTELLDNQTKLLENQQKIIETMPQKSDINRLMETISQIKSKIENPQNDNNITTLQEELEATKKLLEEEREDRRKSRQMKNDRLEKEAHNISQSIPFDNSKYKGNEFILQNVDHSITWMY